MAIFCGKNTITDPCFIRKSVEAFITNERYFLRASNIELKLSTNILCCIDYRTQAQTFLSSLYWRQHSVGDLTYQSTYVIQWKGTGMVYTHFSVIFMSCPNSFNHCILSADMFFFRFHPRQSMTMLWSHFHFMTKLWNGCLFLRSFQFHLWFPRYTKRLRSLFMPAWSFQRISI